MSFWKQKRVLVTGGAGFIGSYLTELLVKAGAQVSVADNLSRGSCERIKNVISDIKLFEGDLSHPAANRDACKGQEIVMNLAARVAGIHYNRAHMVEMFESNMKLEMNILSAAVDAGVKRFLQISTACIYPHDAKVPTPETEGDRNSPEPTNEGYGFAKLMGEKLALFTMRERKMEVVIGRPFNAYGPRDYFDEVTSHVVPAMMKKILDGDDPVSIWGTGNQTRVFIHAKDVARAMMLLAEKAPAGAIVNIGTDDEMSIKELFYMMCKVLGKSPKAFFDTSKPDGFARRAADVTLLKNYTGFVPSISLEEGIRETAEDFLTRK